MTNRLHSFIAAHVVAPLDAVYSRIDDDQLDGLRRAPGSAVAGGEPVRTPRARLHHITH
jgi:hypothetical protein